MELWLALASRREVRDYAPTPIPPEVERRILDAGRLSGSGKNRQPWRFLVVESPDKREALAGLVFAPGNVRGAQLVVAIAVSGKGPASLDAGRCAQNMLLAAWDQGVGGSPNGTPDPRRSASSSLCARASAPRSSSRSAIRRDRATRPPARRRSGAPARTASRSTSSSSASSGAPRPRLCSTRTSS